MAGKIGQVLEMPGRDRALFQVTARVIAGGGVSPDPAPPTTTGVVGSDLTLVVRRKGEKEEGVGARSGVG